MDRAPEGHRPRRGKLTRGTGHAAGPAQIRPARAAGKAPAVWRLCYIAARGSVTRIHVSRTDLRTRGSWRGLVACGTRPLRWRRAQGRHRAQHIRLPSDARGLDPGFGRPCARLRGHRRRSGQHRAAARGDPGLEADGVCRRAGLPEDPARQGQGDGQGRLLLQEGGGGRRRALPLAQGRVQAARRCHFPDLRDRRPRHHCLREPGPRGHDRR